MRDSLPAFLEEAREQAQEHFQNLGYHILRNRWNQFVNRTLKEIPEVCYDPQTELLTLGSISPGCQHCRKGSWDCFFVTSKCNLDCDFCISQKCASHDFQGSNLGKEIEENLERYQKMGILGLSFSGGEALLEGESLFSLINAAVVDNEFNFLF